MQIDNVLAAHAVGKFPTAGLEGFDDEDSFVRAHEGTQIQIAKNLDETTKFDPFPAEKEKIENQNEQNGYQLSAFLAKEDAQEKKDMSDTLSSWEDHRQSLQDELDYQDKLNDVLNENADRTGEQLKRQAKITSEAAEDAADEDERNTAVQIKKFEAGLSKRQARLAEDIVGLPDPSEPSDDERALLKQNIMVRSPPFQLLLLFFGRIFNFIARFLSCLMWAYQRCVNSHVYHVYLLGCPCLRGAFRVVWLCVRS